MMRHRLDRAALGDAASRAHTGAGSGDAGWGGGAERGNRPWGAHGA